MVSKDVLSSRPSSASADPIDVQMAVPSSEWDVSPVSRSIGTLETAAGPGGGSAGAEQDEGGGVRSCGLPVQHAATGSSGIYSGFMAH